MAAALPVLPPLADGRVLCWHTAGAMAQPKRVLEADDTLSADAAYKLICEGTALLWRGDYQNARQMLQALDRRLQKTGQRGAKRASTTVTAPDMAAAFHQHRQRQAQRARVLGMLLIPFDVGFVVPLRRAPDLRAACTQACPEGLAGQPFSMPLRDLLGMIGAYEWRKKGMPVAPLARSGGEVPRIHPHYGVFSPIRGEYLQLVAEAPLPAAALQAVGEKPRAFDIGTGTGVLAAILAARGVPRLVATDIEPRALACARDNLQNLGLRERVTLLQAELFPAGCAPLVVCNPPWVPAKPSSALDAAVYDPDSRMLRGFLAGLAARLESGGEGWLILSDLAEHLGLRSRAQLLEWIAAGGLRVVARHDVRPVHPRAVDRDDSLHAARAREVTSLWRLAHA